jgi:hypothetical protein
MQIPLRFKYIGVILIIMAILYGIQMMLPNGSKESAKDSAKDSEKEGYANAATAYSASVQQNAARDAAPLNMMALGSGSGSGSGSGYGSRPVSGSESRDERRYAYDYNNVSVQYHDSIDDINAQSNSPLLFNQINVRDSLGKELSIPVLSGQVPPVYYTAGSEIYTPQGYVPNYEDSIYLSRSTGMSTLSRYGPTAELMGGFCSYYANDPTTLETKCNALDINTCASTDCCVLLGGTKCVSGSANGPKMRSNYMDPMVINKDVYYYKGNCYGHCS